ncbi:MAG: DUF4832 domain-containing protein [Bacillota bacterium]
MLKRISILFLTIVFSISLLNLQLPVIAYADSETLRQFDFVEETSGFVNPERGWYRQFESNDIWGFDTLRSKGISMILLEVNLKSFLNGPISSAKLNEVSSAFAQARKYGLSVIFRAAYDFDGLINPEPKSMDIITGHIAQFQPIFYANEDVLYCVQAGFLGPWGEWHSSYYGGTPTLEARKTVLFALMDAVPKSRSIQVRRPMFIRDIFADAPGGNVITEETAFNGSNLSRTGYHCDSLLSTSNEYGTYVAPGFSRANELDWVDYQNKYVPFGGETCYLGTNSDSDNAMFELKKLHAQTVNIDYHQGVISKWKDSLYGINNTFNYITNHLGYRFVLDNVRVSSQVQKGGTMNLVINIKNVGFGNPINERGCEIVLSNGVTKYKASIKEDPRRWYRENGLMVKDLYFSIPSNITSGSWKVYLNLPSKISNVSSNSDYSIRIANKDVWESTTGYNLIATDILINTSLSGSNVSTFKQINLLSQTALPTPILTPTLTPTPTPMPTPAPTPTTNPVKSLLISNNTSNISLTVNGQNLNAKSQFFFNSDNNANTGLKSKWKTSGFDYLLENGILYKYTGVYNSWKWTRVIGVSVTKSNQKITAVFGMEIMGGVSQKIIGVAYISNDNRSAVFPALSGSPIAYKIK